MSAMRLLARWRRGAARAALVGALSASAIVAASAQAIFLTAPPEVSRMQSAPSPAPAAPAPEPPAAKVAASAPASPPPVILRRLTNNIQGYRLAGETGVSEWPMFLTEQQARRRLRFQLGYLAAVSVMPEISLLTLTINDQIVGATHVDAVEAVRTVVFDVPPGLMRPGFNSVRLSTQQRHRVDCSLEATHELWTQIDPTQTGLILDDADAGVEQLADLGALPPDEQGALPIRLVTAAGPVKPRDVERLLRAAQLVSIVGRFEQPVVDVGPLAEGRNGVNLLVGTSDELAAVAGDLFAPVAQPRAFVLPATPNRRTSIVVTGADAAQVDAAMKQLLVATKTRGAAAGLRAAAAFPGYRLQGGQRVKLSDLGVKSVEFDGRFFRAAFNIIMPPDFYPADYGRATLRLAGGYAPGLTSKAQIVLSVNERTAVSLPLLRSSGELFKDNPLPIPLGFLRPGLNRIEIEAQVPAPADDSCDTLAPRTMNRFLFLDSTEIEMPAIARVGRMPDLAVTATGGFPYAGAARRSNLYLPRLDAKSIGAAATVAAHLAISAGRPIDFAITEKPPGRGKGPTLAVAPYDAFDPDLLRKLDMPVDELTHNWRDKIGDEAKPAAPDALTEIDASARNRFVLQNNFPVACRPPRTARVKAGVNGVDPQSTGAVAADEPAAAPESEAPAPDLFQEWDARIRTESRFGAALADLATRMKEWGRAKFVDAGAWVRTFESTQKPEMSAQALLAVGQNILGESNTDVWTVVTSPNADTLAESVACLVDPRVSRQIAGRVSVLDLGQAKIESTPVAYARFVATQPLSIGNARLIAAGWLSLHSLFYVGAAMWIAVLLGAVTRIFVRSVGRRSE